MNLEVTIQHYDWGKLGNSSYVAQLASGHVIEENKPYAELWMGTHPNGPSKILKTGQNLIDFISDSPDVLGEKILLKFGLQLPYLFKVLSVAKALSIQAHPDKKLAKKLFVNRPDLYKDPNHKPELAIALTPFEALCGFRPLNEIKFFLQTIPELAALIGPENVTKFFTSTLSDALHDCFRGLMTAGPVCVQQQLDALLKRVGYLDESVRTAQLAALVERLDKQFPGDVGCFVVYFLNFVRLEPGQSLYLGPNEAHAYLSGDCIECMACSDNVVRAGLTPKFKDVDTLCEMLTYQMEPAHTKLLEPLVENDFTKLYAPPVEDFAVARIQAIQASELNLIERLSASILIVISGRGKVGEDLLLSKGTVVFLPANQSFRIVEFSDDLLLFQAFANI